ncbi:DNA-binding transcriptional regulator, AcrR family [Catalinimonas alkaloidigena]|uniref:DNA-binding transcriptional regulator, AcrR family n=1 Tax=Catalinimonas alkaloidigena TaxID=1075417 RepID=A0A1G9D5Z9_9BACT|nr:TetR/AcrR family transcriptional regulator [Catalinimonas alkaloidigena]SDK59297.1 DNA-binding transcriptional regulator, AcrR family [Catalinimonas alkaloidigena]
MAETDKANTEERILEAAHEVFLQKGLDGARMQEIADRAGINKALLHYYFRSKDKLFQQIIGRAVKVMLPRLTQVMNDEVDLFEKIRRVVDTYITFLSLNSYLPIFIINEINRNPEHFAAHIVPVEKIALATLQRQIDEAVAQGQIVPITVPQLLMNIISLCVFPFLGRPLLQLLFSLDKAAFKKEMDLRRTEVAEFIIRGLQPNKD